MSTVRRVLVLAIFVLAATVVGREDLIAQQSNPTAPVLVPITGAADAGGSFSGTLVVRRFDAQGNAVRAIGTLSGALVDATGTTRNVTTRVALPLDVNASIARQNTDPTVALAPCDAMHLEFGVSTVNMRGTTIGLGASAVDIIAGVQPATTSTVAPQAGSVAPQTNGTATNQFAQPGVPASSPLTSSFTAQPGFTAAVAQPASSNSAQLASLMCSTDMRSAAASPAQFAALLNQILTILD
jgi:hypothetical protein